MTFSGSISAVGDVLCFKFLSMLPLTLLVGLQEGNRFYKSIYSSYSKLFSGGSGPS